MAIIMYYNSYPMLKNDMIWRDYPAPLLTSSVELDNLLNLSV